jgi:hypothetical protein
VVERVAERVVRRCWGDEISGDELRALVNKLIERVLAIGACSAPDDRLREW